MGEKRTSVKSSPHSKDSEMMVLGCMLTSETSLNVAADGLDEHDFYTSEHKIIFEVLKRAYKNDKPADVHLVCEELKRINQLEAVGGPAYIATLAQFAGTSAFIEEYVDLVKDKSILRRMIHAAQNVEKIALNEPEDVHHALDEAQQMFFKISQVANPGIGVLIKDLLLGVKSSSQKSYLKEIQDRQENFQETQEGPKITGVPTHFVDLDKIINGFANSNLVILAARPAMGKTALAVNIAENICFKNKMPVGIFSLEMTAEQLLHRIVCSQAQVESDKIRTGALSGVEFQRIVSAVGEMQQHTMLIDDQPGLKITDLRARARRMKESYGVRLLVIDYLQLIVGSGSSRTLESRQNEISEISRMLKTLARELNIPILCLSQLSRKVEDRQGHRPMMSDLRESGCLTGDTLIQNADTGEFYSIKELAERKEQIPFQTYALDKNLKLGKYPLTKAFYSGQKMVYRLKTRTGRQIKASSNHPFLKIEGWTALGELKPGDRIALPREISIAPALDEKILNLAESDVYWDEIISIEEIGVEDVYDATVPLAHNFIANDIIVHNSIEQDSDIVMFLLRREYYDPNDKPGMAELIVAKNRHGGVGNVHLTFIKELAQFRNHTPLHINAPEEEDSPFDSLHR